MNPDQSLSSLTLTDGRQLAYAEAGEPQGKPLLLLSGTGTGRSQAYWFDAAARQAGIRLIVTDRPGYGHSDPRPDLTFLNHAEDVRELLDHLKLSRVTVAGMSGGGGYALACGYRLGERIERVVLVCGIVPAPPEVMKKSAGSVRFLLWLAHRMPRLALWMFERQRGPIDPASPALRRKHAMRPAPDRRVLERADMLELAYGAPMRDAMRQGWQIFVHELGLYCQPLGFELAEVRVPVRVWHGEQDVNVSVEIARYVAASVPGAKLRVEPDAAHLFAFENPTGLMQQVIAP